MSDLGLSVRLIKAQDIVANMAKDAGFAPVRDDFYLVPTRAERLRLIRRAVALGPFSDPVLEEDRQVMLFLLAVIDDLEEHP